ncbi:hypothetical protein [Poriferisphaera sp. WC338]|uniref:hypothetical protein n=1 Tax=Poriferisphaera sp. WC338 TaxID=3425129 RepID=UPI003D8174E5
MRALNQAAIHFYLGLVAFWGALLLMTVHASAARPMILLDQSLKTQRIYLIAMNEDEIVYYDLQQRLQKRDLKQVVRLTTATKNVFQLPDHLGMIEFIDGQRITGKIKFRTPAAEGEGFYWESMLGVERAIKNSGVFDERNKSGWTYTARHRRSIPVRLDDLRAASFSGPIQQYKNNQPQNDLVTLLNGEILQGFVVGFEQGKLQLEQDQDGLLNLNVDHLAELQLMQDQPEVQSQYVVNLTDGSRLYAHKLNVAKEVVYITVSLTGQGEDDLELPLTSISQIDIQKHGYKILPLHSLQVLAAKPAVVFGLTHTPSWESGVLHLHAPASMRFELPSGAAYFSAEAQLDETQHSDDDLRWADMTIMLKHAEHNQKVVYPLNRREAKQILRADVESEKWIEIVIDEGVNGPIMDRLRITNGKVLVYKPTKVEGLTDSGQLP